MKLKIKFMALASLSAALFVAGCQQTSQQRRPVPVAALAPEPAPEPPAVHNSCTDPTGGLVKLSKVMPREAALGQPFEYHLIVAAEDCSGNVVVTDEIPQGASFVRSEPAAQAEGNKVVWRLGALDAGQTETIRVWIQADTEGTLTACATVSADPRVCASTFVGKPALSIEKSGPETAILGSTINYTILVSNNGSAVARGVVVVDTVPDGLESANGQKEISYEVGDLAPNQSKTISVALRATQRGKFCNLAVATSSNAGKAQDDACTTVLQPGLKIVKTGDKERFLTRTANYQIVVSNTGDTPLTDVTITDTAPAGTTIVSANGASVTGNQAVWRIPTLAAGENASFDLGLTSTVAGNHCNTATVTTAGGLRESAEACTLWRGVAAVLLEAVDDPDPIQVDEQTTYTVRVTNQGTADLTNVGISVVFDEEMSPVSASEGTVSGQGVNFAPVPRLAPKQSISYSIRAKGVRAGDARNKVSLTAGGLETPVVEEESTRVY